MTDAQKLAIINADALTKHAGLPSYSDLAKALQVIGTQSPAPDWTIEQAFAFARRWARAHSDAARGSGLSVAQIAEAEEVHHA